VLNHGKWPHGTDWLCEAAAECYIPILATLEKLQASGVPAKISMDFSPINLEQLADQRFVEIFSDYCDEKIMYAERDYHHFGHIGEKGMQPTTEFWREFYLDKKRRLIDHYDGNIVSGFRKLSDAGVLDAMTCGVTHGYFPLLLDDRHILAQLRIATQSHETHFGKKPRGVWLPECGYRPGYEWSPPAGAVDIQNRGPVLRKGIEELVAQVGLEYFFVDGHLIYGDTSIIAKEKKSTKKKKKEVETSLEERREKLLKEGHDLKSLAAIYSVKSTTSMLGRPAVSVFAREAKTAMQVWSSDHGYPGGGAYLDFSKKHTSGLRYWRVTGSGVDIGDKKPYDPEATEKQLTHDAADFAKLIKAQLKEHDAPNEGLGIISAPFDTELFGHWWFEGPRFLGKVIERLAEKDAIVVTNCAEAIDIKTISHGTVTMPEGSWGFMGGHHVWMNQEVRWIWDKIYLLEDRWLKTLDYARASYDSLTEEVVPEALFFMLEQAGREMLLLEASDWPFLITNKGADDYATLRVKEHAEALTLLLDTIDAFLNGEGIDEDETARAEELAMIDSPFADLKLSAWY
jgi:1,4-alpha-glucan branching enzyme